MQKKLAVYNIELKIYSISLGNTVTIMSPEGKPVEVNASALQAASSQNAVGMFDKSNTGIKCFTMIAIFFKDSIIL